MALCEKHSGCQFPAFTNGMLSDDAFADEMLRAKKFIPAISLKGSEGAGGALCTTSSVNMDQCRDCFALRAETREAVGCVALSGEMSSCCQNVCRAAEAFGNVQVADSRTLSSAQGLPVRAGCSGREIAGLLRAETARVHSSFLRHRLDSMRKGCRCSAVAALIANLMHLKPCIAVHDSAMGVVKTYRGSFAVPAPAAAWPSPCIPPHPSAGGCFRAVWRARTGCTVPCHC